MKRTVAVLFGGRSLEHDVSVVSGLQILHALDPGAYSPMPVYIDHDSRWWIGDELWREACFKGGGPDRSGLTEVSLSPGFGSSDLMSVDEGPRVTAHRWHVDVFVPVLHGTFGEDGCIQGLLDFGGCAYVGCGVTASAIGMNKRLTKVLAAQAGVPVLPGVSCDRSVLDRDRGWMERLSREVEDAFGWPVIVKPCNLGSSAGVSVATSSQELVLGVMKVFQYDLEAVIEPFIRHRLEINVAVAGLDGPVASVTEMPLTLEESPLTFQEKYKRHGRKSVGSATGMAGALRVLDPQDVPADMRTNAQEYATRVFSTLGCEGISRIDFLIDADKNDLYFNEINTLPGSMAFYLWSAAPRYWTITELLSRLILRAERVQAIRRGLQRRPTADLSLLG